MDSGRDNFLDPVHKTSRYIHSNDHLNTTDKTMIYNIYIYIYNAVLYNYLLHTSQPLHRYETMPSTSCVYVMCFTKSIHICIDPSIKVLQ